MRAAYGATWMAIASAIAACAAPIPMAPRLSPVEAPLVLEPPARPRSSLPKVTLGDLTVERAIVLTLENNRDLEVQTLAPVLAGTFEAIERGTYDPELFVDATYFEETASQTARATGERFDVSGRATDERIGVRQRLPTGTTLEAVLRHRLDVSDRTPLQNEARVGITVTQSLLQGFGPMVNLAALQQAGLAAEATLFELGAFVEALVASAEIAYWTQALAEEEVETVARALEVAEREAEEVEARVEVGLLPPLETAAAEAEVALRKQALIDAQSRLSTARLRLLRILTPSPDGALDAEVRAVSPLSPRPAPVQEVEARCALALVRRPELGQARALLARDQLQVVRTEHGLLPRLDAFVAFNKTGFDRGFAGAFQRLDEPTYDLQAGLSMDWFIGHRAARAVHVAARVTAEQARLAVENLEVQVGLEVRLAAVELERARAQIGAIAATRAARARAVDAERARLEVGSGTSLQLARALRDLLESELAELRAAVEYRIANVQLFRAEGSLLARRGFTVRAR